MRATTTRCAEPTTASCSCISWRKHNRADHPISYLDTLIKTGSESIEATIRRRRILFAGFVARMEDTRLPKCVMFGELVGGAGCMGVRKKGMRCFLDDLRAFGINADRWTTAAQDDGEWRKTVEQGAERFMAKLIAAEKTKAGLRHVVVCPNVTGRTKERIAQTKRARAGSLAVVDSPQVARTCILRADVVLSFSGVTLVLFLFRFRLSRFYQSHTALRSIVSRYACAPAATSKYLPTVCVFVCLVSWEVSPFPSILCYRFFFVWRVPCTFSFRMVFFYFVTTGWILTSISLRENSLS